MDGDKKNVQKILIIKEVKDADGNVVLRPGDHIWVPVDEDADPADDLVVHAGDTAYVESGQQGRPSKQERSDRNREIVRAVGRNLGKAGRAGAAAGAVVGSALAGAGAAALTVAGTAGEAVGSAAKTAGEAIRERSQAKSAPEAVAEKTTEFSEEQAVETEEFAREFIRKLLRVKAVRIDRKRFLTSELRDKGVCNEQIAQAIESRPAEAHIPRSTMNQIAREAIELEVRQATGASFLSGLPGGWAIVATIPADLTQYYAHVFRLIQKLAYIYGWQSFFDELDNVTDETIYELLAFLGVAMGVEGAGSALSKIAVRVAQPAVTKHVTAMTLTKTAWYPIVKKVLNFIGVSITKSTVGKAAGMAVPVLGGFVCGGITFATLTQSGTRLQKHLAEGPLADPNMEARAKQMDVEYEIEV